MFHGCISLEFLDVSSFDTQNVTDMGMMFDIYKTSEPNMTLTKLDVSHFDTSKVINMMYMFHGCGGVTELDVSNFNTGKVTDMRNMFEYCKSVKKLDTKNFDTSNVTGISWMFAHCNSLEDLDVSGFHTNKVTDMKEMFSNCCKLKTLDLSNFNFDAIEYDGDRCELRTALCYMHDLTLLKLPANWSEQAYLPSDEGYIWQDEDGANCIEVVQNTDKVKTYTRYTVAEITPDILYQGKDGNLDWKIDKSGTLTIDGTGDYKGEEPIYSRPEWTMYAHSVKNATVNVKGITKTKDMFWGCEKMAGANLTQLDTSQVTDMSYMFYRCGSLESIDLQTLDTGHVTNMECMFNLFSLNGNIVVPNTTLKTLDLSHFDTSNVFNMKEMFHGCAGLETIDVSVFDTKKVWSMEGMFSYCKSLRELDLSNFSVKNLSNASRIVDDLCNNLMTLKIPANWNIDVTMPYSRYGWKDENGKICKSITKRLSTPMTYMRCDDAQIGSPSPAPTTPPSVKPAPSPAPTSPIPSQKPDEAGNAHMQPVGTTITLSGNVGKFKVTSSDANNPTVEYKALTKAGKKKKTISIPEYISYKGVKYRVTSVASKCFKNNKKLTNVKTSSSITKIGDSAFEGCTNLKTATIGKGLKTIGKNAFKNCKSLKKLTLKGTKLKSVGKTALKGVNAKCKIKVPSKKLKSYKQLFKGKGQRASVKITK